MKKSLIIGLLIGFGVTGSLAKGMMDDFKPTFTTLNGNLFMVAELPELMHALENGSKVQFVFRGNESRVLYHIQTSNSSMVTDQKFDFLALVPEEVTRSLMNKNLKKIIIDTPEGKQVLKFKKGEVRIARSNG